MRAVRMLPRGWWPGPGALRPRRAPLAQRMHARREEPGSGAGVHTRAVQVCGCAARRAACACARESRPLLRGRWASRTATPTLTLSTRAAQVHCENADALVDAQERVFASGVTGPEGHYLSRPAVFEVRRGRAGPRPVGSCDRPGRAPPGSRLAVLGTRRVRVSRCGSERRSSAAGRRLP